jgi:hypothetical protein
VEQLGELHVDLALASGAHLVVVRLARDAELLHEADHLAAEIVVGVGRADGEVAALVRRLVAQVRLLEAGGVPRTLDGVDLVHTPVLRLFVADLVEDEELRLGADVNFRAGRSRGPSVLP